MDTLKGILTKQKRMIKMRKYMTKEVTITKAMLGLVGIDENGLPKVTDVETIELLGELTKEKAEKKLRKAGNNKTLFKVDAETRTYKMEVSKFIKVATLVTEDDNVDEEEEEIEEETEETPTPKKGKVTIVTKEGETVNK